LEAGGEKGYRTGVSVLIAALRGEEGGLIDVRASIVNGTRAGAFLDPTAGPCSTLSSNY